MFPDVELSGPEGGLRLSHSKMLDVMKIEDGRQNVDVEDKSHVELSVLLLSCQRRNEMVGRLFRLMLKGEVKVEAVL